MREAARLSENPGARLAEAYTHIWHTRMAGVPILNPKLAVEAVDFRPWQGQWLGALVTPWSLNLVLLPGEGTWTTLRAGAERFVAFPAGRFRFIAAHDPAFGECHSCSLFSPVLEFADHAAACLTARAALAGLFDAAHAPAADHLLRQHHPEPAAISKRDFISGKFSGTPHADRG